MGVVICPSFLVMLDVVCSVLIVFVFVTDLISSYGGIIFGVVSPSLIILAWMSVLLGW